MSTFSYSNLEDSAIYVFKPQDFWEGQWRYSTFDLRESVKNNPELQYLTRGEYHKYCGSVPKDGNALGVLSQIKLDH